MTRPRMTARVWMALLGALIALAAAVVIPTMLVRVPDVDPASLDPTVGQSGATGASGAEEITGTETKGQIDQVVRWLFVIAAASAVMTVVYGWHTSPRRRVRLAGVPAPVPAAANPAPDPVAAGFVGTTVAARPPEPLTVPPARPRMRPPAPVAGTVSPERQPPEPQSPEPQPPEPQSGPSSSAPSSSAPSSDVVIDVDSDSDSWSFRDANDDSELPGNANLSLDEWSAELAGLDEPARKVATERLAAKLFPRREHLPSAPNPRPTRPNDARSAGSA